MANTIGIIGGMIQQTHVLRIWRRYGAGLKAVGVYSAVS